MSYFGGTRGMVGDPGFFDTLFGVAKRAVRTGVAFATGGPIAAAKVNLPQRFRTPKAVQLPIGKIPTIGKAFVPPSAGGFGVPAGMIAVAPRRRRMNAGNAKALRRAIRRTDAFVRLSRSALKNTGFKIVSKSSGRVSRATMDKAVAAAHHAK